MERVLAPFKTVVRFFKDVWSELQRVVWPSHEETYGFTGVVIIGTMIAAAWVGVLDVFFTKVVGALGLYK